MPFPNIGPGELILILIIALVVLGPGKLPDVAQSLGKSVREFRKAATDITEAGKIDVPPPSEQATPPPAALAVPAPEPMPAAVATPPAADPVVTPAATAQGDPATAAGDTRDSNPS
jgi:sec-independent protein translocase protein TatA